MTTSTTTTNTAPNLPIPAGAHRVQHWQDGSRYFETPRIVIPIKDEDVVVFTAGFQHDNGSTTREICVNQLHPDNPITVAQARQIARALMAAADAVERWGLGEVTAPSN
ncbi:MAG: hypothetical protein KDB55_07025 [Mycobacterium sp.]|nr:hypothetical protein [Mycobacterium sp.]